MSKRVLLGLAVLALLAPACRSDDNNQNPGKDSSVYDKGGSVSESSTEATETTIYKIKQKSIAQGTVVRLNSVVVSAVDENGSYTGDVYVQETAGGKYSGIKLYTPTRTDGGKISELEPGDVVKVEGKVSYWAPKGSDAGAGGFNDSKHPNKQYVIEIDKGASLTKIKSGTAPTPADVTASELITDPTADAWEDVLVRIKTALVTSDVDSKYGSFTVKGGLSVDDELYPATVSALDCYDITGLSIYFYSYYLDPRSSADLVKSTGCPSVKSVTIPDLHDTSSSNHPAVGDLVKVSGTISAVDTTKSGSYSRYYGFWIQEDTCTNSDCKYGGIYVYYYWDDSTASAKVPHTGDKVELSASYTEYTASGDTTAVSELQSIIVWTVKGTGGTVTPTTISDPSTIATGGSAVTSYVGVLVKVENVTVASLSTTSTSTVGIKLATSGLLVENELYNFMSGSSAPAVNDTFTSIVGPLHYDYKNYKILPRQSADLAK
jgi:hypothetical protein